MPTAAEIKARKRFVEVTHDLQVWASMGRPSTEFEISFLQTLVKMVQQGKSTLDLSEKQMECFERLERKIYS